MSARGILRMGDPRLRMKARAVDRFGDDKLANLITDMLDTMKAFDGAGLAAPQIGVALRVVIFGIDKNLRYPDAPPVPLTIPDQSRNLARRGRNEFGLGGMPERARHARPGSPLYAYPLSRTGCGREGDRSEGAGLSCARRPTRMRSPRRHPLSRSHRGPGEFRLHRGTSGCWLDQRRCAA